MRARLAGRERGPAAGRWARASRWVLAGLALASLAGCDLSTSSPQGSAGASPSPTPAETPTAGATASPEATAPQPLSPTPATTPSDGVARPDRRLTPGEALPTATVAVICRAGYTSTVRNVTVEQRREVYAAYGVPYPQPRGTYELDHLISLELGGDNANANLWPQAASPAPGFHQKDELENRMHELVCSGQLDLHEAQHEIATDWYAAYRKYLAPG